MERNEVVWSGKGKAAGRGKRFQALQLHGGCGTAEEADAVPVPWDIRSCRGRALALALQNHHRPSPIGLTSTGTMGKCTKPPVFLPSFPPVAATKALPAS